MRQSEPKECHGRDDDAWDDKIHHVKEGPAPDYHGIGYVDIWLRTASILFNVLYARHAWKMYERRFLPSDSFSPESGGNVKPSTAIEAISTQGTIRLKK